MRAPRAVVASALLTAACAGAPPARPTGVTASPAPRLVVLLVIDQWPEWAFEQKRPALTGGFDRLLREGSWQVGHHPSAATITACGHALLGTGQPPARSGILANEWWHRDLDRSLKSVEDERGAPSARWLRVASLGDAVAAAHTGGKAVSVSLKDRAAILPLGHAGTPLWLDHHAGRWRSTQPVAWLDAWNAAHPLSAVSHTVWTPLPDTPARAGVPDDAPGEGGGKGMGPTFPHDLGATKDPADAVFATPIGNDLVLDTAGEAIDREQLGADDHPDLLVISLSAHDLVGHFWGQESWESWDTFVRLDRRLGAFLDELDRKVGAGRWAMIATSDHGGAPMPESLHGGRLAYDQIKEAANRAAIAELGPGEWIAAARYPTVYLSRAALAQKPRDLAIATTKILYALRSFPGLARVERAAELWGHCETRTGDDAAICLALDPERSGDIVFLPAPGWVMQDGDERATTGHGSLHAYDREVPVVSLPIGRAAHPALARPDGAPIAMETIADRLASWLGVPAPRTLPPPAP